MPEPSWDLNSNRLQVSPSEIHALEQRIAQVPPNQRSDYQLRQMGITIPPGYRLGPDGRLTYVAVDNGQHWYNKPEVMIPLILSGGLAAGGALGGAASGAADGGLAASVGAPAATEAGIFGSPAATASLAASGAAPVAESVFRGAASKVPWGDIAKTAIPIGGALAANRLSQPDASSGSAEMPPELRELLNLQLHRIQQSQPNYDLMLNMARGMAPKWARDTVPQGGSNPSLDLIQRMAGPR